MSTAFLSNPVQWILGIVLILAALGVVLARKPVIASLYFLVTLLALAALYLQLSASFIGVMQVLVYAGAILVIFMFVMILFQDAHQQISQFQAQSAPVLLFTAACAFVLVLGVLGRQLVGIASSTKPLPDGYGTVESLGKALYIDFFFPFEAVIFLFLIAIIGALYVGRKVE